MVADIAVHHDNPKNPHAHILLTLREIGPDGFGLKQRDWNRRELVSVWRESWPHTSTRRSPWAAMTPGSTHRSHAERGLSMTPGVKIGAGLERRVAEDLPTYIAERIETQKEISRQNGEQIIADPGRALDAHWWPTRRRSPSAKSGALSGDPDRWSGAVPEGPRRRVLASPELVQSERRAARRWAGTRRRA
jgi:hypothetical protein